MATTEARLEDQKSNSPTTTKAGSSQRSLVLAIMTLEQFMVIVDSTIVQVALPSIGREFGVSVNGLQWIVTAYGLALAGFLMLSGRGGISTVTRSCSSHEFYCFLWPHDASNDKSFSSKGSSASKGSSGGSHGNPSG
jgi:hypothetical protein